jgi:uncharacterized membrane protein YphA (DoxX/SURF4 family)
MKKNALSLSLSLSLSRGWLKPAAHDQRRSVDLVRFALAAILITHPLHALVHPEDARQLAEVLARFGASASFGAGVAWAAVALQIAASVALVVPRFVFGGAIGSIAIASCSLILHAPRWYVVGGFAVDGRPGIEFDALVLACLAAVAWTYGPRRAASGVVSGVTGLEIIRVASALSLLAHCWGPFVLWDVEGMHGWGEAMSAAGWPMGVALVWSIKGTELVCSVLRLSRRLVVPACFGHLSYLVPALYIEHEMHWFVEGPAENGIEFPLLIVICSVACIAAYWPPRAAGARAVVPAANAGPVSPVT